MLILQDLKNNLTSHLIAGDISQFQHANAALLTEHFPCYRYTQFRHESQRATYPLSTMAQLLSYHAYYAQEHFDRLNYLMDKLCLQFTDSEQYSLTIVDYGCGQGLATLAFMQNLLKDHPQCTLTIHLVEPSAPALQLAEHYVRAVAQSHFASQITVHAHQCSIDDLSGALFNSAEPQRVVHLFSNVLDLAPQGYFNLAKLARQWDHIQGKQLFLCVGPVHYQTRVGFEQLMQLTDANQLVKSRPFEIASAGYRSYYNQPIRYISQPAEGRMMGLWCDNNHFLQARAA